MIKQISFLIILTIISINTNLLASEKECADLLTDGNRISSNTFTVEPGADDEDFSWGPDFQADSIYAIRVVLGYLGCAKADINFGKGPYGRSEQNCQRLSSGKPYSTVCYIESNLGFFFVHQDFQGHMQVNYNRWD